MSKFKIKLAKRIMAVVLSGAMVMSNMSAYAAELAPETTTEVVSESEETGSDVVEDAGEKEGSDNENNKATFEQKPTGVAVAKEGTGDNVSYKITWTGVSAPTGYGTVTYTVKITAADVSGITKTASDTNVTVPASELTEGKEYTVVVSAEAVSESDTNDKITSEESEAQTFTYEKEQGSNLAMDAVKGEVTPVDGKENVVKFSWNEVKVTGDGATDYTVKYHVTVTKKSDNSSVIDKEVVGGATEIEVGSGENGTLEAGAVYTFEITATAEKSGADPIEKTDRVEYTIPSEAAKLDAPANVKAELNDTKDGVVVSWDVVNDVSYEVVAKEQGDDTTAGIKKEVSAVTDATENQKATVTFTLTDGLVRGKSYKFSVTAKKEGSEPKTTEGTDVVQVPEEQTNPGQNKTYTLDVTDWTAENKEYGSQEAAGDGYFTIHYNADTTGNQSKIEARAKTIGTGANEFKSKNDVNMQGTILIEADEDGKITNAQRAIEFTTGSTATVKIWWEWGGNGNADKPYPNRNLAIYKGACSKEDAQNGNNSVTKTETTTNATHYSELTLDEAGTYYLGNIGVGGSRIYKIEVTTDYDMPARKAWGQVNDPTVTTVTDTENPANINVTVNAVVGYDGGDSLTVTMLDEEGNVVKDEQGKDAIKTTAYLNSSHEFSFTPTASGTYKFKAELSRKDETEKTGEATAEFVLPFSAPEGLKAVDKSEGDTAAVELSWTAVTGADCYVVIAKEKDAAEDAEPVFRDVNVTDTKLIINTGLQREKTYIFSVQGKINATETEAEKTTEASEYEFKIPAATSGDNNKKTKTYVLDIAEEFPDVTAQTSLDDGGSLRAGENDFFTVYYKKGGKSRIDYDNPAKEFKDPTTNETLYSSNKCINMQTAGDAKALNGVIRFETTTPNAQVTIYWRGGGNNNRTIAIVDGENNIIKSETTAADYSAGTPVVTKFTLDDAGTYYVSCIGGGQRIFRVEVETEIRLVTYVMDIAEAFPDVTAQTSLDDGGSLRTGEKDFFTVYYKKGGKSRIDYDNPAKEFKDPDTNEVVYSSNKCINMQTAGDAKTLNGVIQFETAMPNTPVTIYWRGGGNNNRTIAIVDGENNIIKSETTAADYSAGTPVVTKFTLEDAGTYYVSCIGGGQRIFRVEVTTEEVVNNKTRVEWPGTIAAPAIKSITLNEENKGILNVLVDANVDYYEGGDRVTVYMKNVNDTEETEVIGYSANEAAQHTIPFTPDASGTYSFRVELSRTDSTEVISGTETKIYENFILPLAKPSISRATNKGVDGSGLGSMEIAYSQVPEAVKYFASAVEVEEIEEDGKTVYKTVEGAEPINVESEKTTAIFSGLTVGKYYAFTVYAYRGDEDISEISAPFYKIVKNEVEQVWDFSAYGVSTSTTSTATNVDGEKVTKNAYSGDVNDGKVRVWALGNGGKIVPDSSEDGLSFVYTTVDKDTNFTLEATAHVNSWTYSNGQEGFGLMMADDVGENGYTGTFWNNSYMAVATKMQYYWDGASILPSDVGPAEGRSRYNMYLGIGTIARTGVTDAWPGEFAAGATKPSLWSANSYSLEHGAATAGKESGGNYNVIGNHVAGATAKSSQDIEPLLTDIKLRIQKNNTGYFVTYIDADGIETTQKFYDSAIYESNYAKQNLLQIDKEHIYVGFFAGRNADVTFTDISFKTVSVADDAPPEEIPPTYNLPTYTIPSASITNSEEYELQFNTNWQGTLSIKDAAGNELVNEALYKYLAQQETTVLGSVKYEKTNKFDKFFTYEYKYDGYVKDENGEDKLDENGNKIPNYTLDENNNKIIDYTTVKLKANVKALIPIVADVKDAEGNVIEAGVNQASLLSVGANTFTYTFTPDRNWHLNDDEHQFLSSYDTFVQTITVNYRKYGTNESNLYVSPTGKANGDGTQESPLDIYTAVKYVQAGQTIVLMDGTYNLKSPLTIERGIDGTADKQIRMVTQNPVNRSNPWAKSSVIFDFNGVASGMTIAGDYWYFRGFDVTNSSDGNKGIQVSGSHNVLDQINAYANGNTGIQLSRYKGTDIDMSDDWPADNLILNCTSYLNADSGFEDADGFAAKLTIGDGNVFDGCIAAYNADDGWDLYAKAESGKIGQVTIQNSVAFKNGYVLWNGSGELDIQGTNEIDAGNGNGFKMGGESLKGHHMLLNSYSFLNKANGIESNSCPDIQVFNSVSFNNESANIAFYTRNATYTEYRAYNIISIRTTGTKKDNFDKATPSGTGNSKDQNYDNESNFYWRTEASTAADNGKNALIKADDFANLTFGGISAITRNENGTINIGNFLSLKDTADKTHFVDLSKSTLTDPDGVTYNTYVAAEGETSDLPGIPNIGGTGTKDEDAAVDTGKDTDGTIDSSDDTDNTTSDIWTDEEFAQLDKTGSTLKILLDLDYDKNGNYYTDYTGIALKPAVRVAYGTTELSTKNYSVSYKNTTKAYELLPGDEGFDAKLAPTVIIKGKGNYAGTYNLYFTIKKIDMGRSDKVVSADVTTVATGKAQKINPVVTFDGKKLGAKEYSISTPYTKTTTTNEETGEITETTAPYTGAYEAAGIYYIDLTGAEANFTGTKTVKVTVLSESEAASKTSMSKVKVAKIPDQIYDGTAHYPTVTVEGLTQSATNSEGVFVQGDYDVAYYNNTDVGIASVVLTGNLEKGYYGTRTVTFKTVAKPFNVKDYSVTVRHNGKYYTTDEEYKSLSIPSTGSAVTFGNVVVKVIANEGSEDKTLREGVDYTVSYSGNNKAGKASIVIKGMGDFKGKMARSFTITPLEITPSNTTVTVADQEYAKGGVKPSVVVKVNGKTISPNYYSVNYANNNKISTDSDKATVSITGKKLLKGSIKDAAAFRVTAKDLSTLTVSADDVYYGTAKSEGDLVKYMTKLAVIDSNGKKLSLKSDYDVNYYYYNSENVYTKLEKNDKIPFYDGKNMTIYVEIVAGTKGFYKGTLNTTYNVVGKNDIRSAKVEKITDTYAYNDTAVSVPTDKLVVKIQNRTPGSDGKYVKDRDFTTLTLNTDYKIVNIKNNDKYGTATITLQGMGNYCGTNKATFKIAKKELSSWNYYIAYAIVNNITVDIDEADAANYKEEGITFDNLLKSAAKITDASGNALTCGTHFTATYTDNTIDTTALVYGEDGYATKEATVTIKGIAPYTGSRTIPFTIRVKKAEAQ